MSTVKVHRIKKVAKAHHPSSCNVGHPVSQPALEPLALRRRIVAPIVHNDTVVAQVNRASRGKSHGLCRRLPTCARPGSCHLAPLLLVPGVGPHALPILAHATVLGVYPYAAVGKSSAAMSSLLEPPHWPLGHVPLLPRVHKLPLILHRQLAPRHPMKGDIFQTVVHWG
jgi:hypothetical protein